jgi:glycosyltransferase involved in cell wall biosynthesis
VRVSVLIPCWNEPPERLRATVSSASAADEVIVVDDGSDEHVDGAVRIEHAGIAAALNAGARAATGDYVCWLSVGDRMYPSKVALQLGWMLEHGHVASFHDYENSDGVFRTLPGWRTRLETDNQFCGSTVMVARCVALALPWDESLTYAVDWDWACRVEFDGPGWAHMPGVLGAAYELPGGHTMTAEGDPALWAKKCKDRLVVHKRWRRANRIARKAAE